MTDDDYRRRDADRDNTAFFRAVSKLEFDDQYEIMCFVCFQNPWLVCNEAFKQWADDNAPKCAERALALD